MKLFSFITGRNEVVAKVMFLQVCVCPQEEGVCLSACWDAIPPPEPGRPPWDQGDTPPGTRETPLWDQGDTPWTRETPRDQADPPRTRQTLPQDLADPPSSPSPLPPREADSSIRSTSGLYASYWNAFLFHLCLAAQISPSPV